MKVPGVIFIACNFSVIVSSLVASFYDCVVAVNALSASISAGAFCSARRATIRCGRVLAVASAVPVSAITPSGGG
jgi:hypothetical protein